MLADDSRGLEVLGKHLWGGCLAEARGGNLTVIWQLPGGS